jgi:2-dehydro-3-deoxygluconokinase
MLEFRQTAGADHRLGFGGDAFNTAVYAARLGLDVGFISALGDDYYSDWLIEQWQREGVGCRDVRIIKDTSPGLYIIRNDESGERYFHYWRAASPFRRLFEDVLAEDFEQQLGRYDWVYYTGIGLALLCDAHRESLLGCIERYRGDGGRVAFDPNYRPILWDGHERAAAWIDRAYSQADLILPSLDDEASLRSELDATALLHRLEQFDADEIVIKSGEAGCSVAHFSEFKSYPLERPVAPIDTTAAGDSFNAAYLSTRMTGGTIAAAVRSAQALAAKVVMHRGAIIQAEFM